MHALLVLMTVLFLRNQPVILLIPQEPLSWLLIARAQLTSMDGTLPSLTIPNQPPVPENARLALTVLSLLVELLTPSKMFAIARLTFMVKPELLPALNALELTPTPTLVQLLPLVPWLLK